MNSDILTPAFDLGAAWREARRRAWLAWSHLPRRWRGEPALLAVGAIVALVLLAAFHQVVHAGVDRAAARDAAARRHLSIAAICSLERDADQRALCLLTRPAGHGEMRVAAAR